MNTHRCRLTNETKLADHSTSLECFVKEAKQSPLFEEVASTTFIDFHQFKRK